MPRPSLRIGLSVLFVLSAVRAACAQRREPTPAEQEFAALEARYAPPIQAALPPAPATAPPVQQAAYLDATGGKDTHVVPAPNSARSTSAAPTVFVPASNGSIYPAPQPNSELIVPPASDSWCLPPQPPLRTSSWTAAVELIPTVTRLTDWQFGRWEDDSTLALRLILGYEDPEGIGVRARFWGLSQDAETPADDVELNMGSFNLDLYKRVLLDRGELAFGGGPASGGLEFKLSDDTHSRFEGAGGDMFLDGYYALVEFDKAELGAVARGRYTILLGDWRDTTGDLIVPSTDNDTMTVAELAWGLELRRRFGPCEDHSWFLGILAEYQRWQSDWMSNLAGTSIGASGVNFYTGLNW
jgi:hypothetical protein